jgi:hypothetical protein
MKHYAITMKMTSGAEIRLVYKALSERSAVAAAHRKLDFQELIKVEQVAQPADITKTNRRFWVIQCKDMHGSKVELYSTSPNQNTVRNKMVSHPKCESIIRIDEVCESEYLKRSAKKTLV